MKYTILAVALFSSFVTSADSITTGTGNHRIGPTANIEFATRTDRLTEQSKATLKNLTARAQNEGKIAEVAVAVWSDNPVPRENEELSVADRNLAAKRARAIQKYFNHPLSISDVDTYNMAEQSTWLSRAFHTSDAELKMQMDRGGNHMMSNEEFQIFKNQGQPSKAVIVMLME